MIKLTAREQDAIYAKLKARDAWDGPNNPDCVIISAERATFEHDDNSRLTAELEGELQALRLPYKRVLGSYLGRQERAFCVVLAGDVMERDRQYVDLCLLAYYFGQESILYLDKYRHATLHYTKANTPRTKLGKFRPVTEKYALQCASWTYDIDQDQYFTTE